MIRIHFIVADLMRNEVIPKQNFLLLLGIFGERQPGTPCSWDLMSSPLPLTILSTKDYRFNNFFEIIVRHDSTFLLVYEDTHRRLCT